ncbi:high-affinity Zn(2+) transporter zrt1 [Dissophora globulifera]|uniref:High-affinity Zn(2+) transporter zrt1 n=1 Tax=Dissophora globulifera TaxID=979702 RepID=A0A9P6RRM2_9FUNG|nr:high-affinity Zn(2+) transporter zrt1 [Dissophora globulifera]
MAPSLPSPPLLLTLVRALVDPALPEFCQGQSGNPSFYRLDLHIAGVLIILAASTAGVFMPLIASRFHSLRLSPRTLTLGKQFGTGVILATAFIHMMPTAMSNLSSPCLGPIFSENYTAFGGLVILSSSLVMHWIEFFAMEHTQRRMHEAAAERGISASSGHINVDLGGLGATGVAAAPCPGHVVTVIDEAICRKTSCASVSSCTLDHHSAFRPDVSKSCSGSEASQASSSLIPADRDVYDTKIAKSYGSIVLPPSTDSLSKPADRHHHHYQEVGHSHAHGLEILGDSQRRISTYILEAGVAAHSVIIGISLGVSSGVEFVGLLTALVFHQFFEGFSLGARIADLEFDKTYTHYMLALIFSLATPIGATIGIAISNTYNPSSVLAILLEGVFDAISAGILLYMGYVNLLAVEFNLNGEIRKESFKVKSMCFLALWAGAAIMAVIGRFA